MECDLIDLSEYAGHNNKRQYAVTAIDCFTKYAWLVPITQKKAKNVHAVLGPILSEHQPKILQTDNGGEFTAELMRDLYESLGIKHISSFPYKPSSNGQIERFNRTIKGMILQYMAAHDTRKYIDVIDKILHNYNNTYHTTIKETPQNLFNGKHVGRARKSYHHQVETMLRETVKTRGVSGQLPEIHDYVRVSRTKVFADERELDLKGFRKHFGSNYTDDVYQVVDVVPKKNSRTEYLLRKAFLWTAPAKRSGKYIDAPPEIGRKLLPQIFYGSELLVIPTPRDN